VNDSPSPPVSRWSEGLLSPWQTFTAPPLRERERERVLKRKISRGTAAAATAGAAVVERLYQIFIYNILLY
jgi:hypothetical protein